ncbi:NADP-dependent oxidoreductase [Aeromicrobium sp. CF3.5]|uniref:NADP-dependent oxidoreductase n=1 Tax=Aeromicrobium sp. CF3.5 TaxID=3373078 RepID=UPI003EE49351
MGISAFGGPEVVEVLHVQEPAPRAGEVRIVMEAAALNPVDAATREGILMGLGFHGEPPLTFGWDVAGTVDMVGADVWRLSPGDRVIGISTHMFDSPRTHSELVVLSETAVAAIPAELDAGAGSTLPLAGLTALQALDLLALRRGQSVLITGAGGAVGTLALQLARMRGLKVVGAGAARHRQLVLELGAHEFVETSELAQNVRHVVPGGVDGAIDAGVVGQACLDAVVESGAHVSLVVLERPAPLRDVRSESFAVRPDWEQLTLLSSLAATGSLRTGPVRWFSFDEAVEAHRALAAGGLGGARLVLRP